MIAMANSGAIGAANWALATPPRGASGLEMSQMQC